MAILNLNRYLEMALLRRENIQSYEACSCLMTGARHE